MGHALTEQQLAALDRHLHCAVLASAGSGKTRILIERFIRAIVVDGIAVDKVVAITFTKAAAAEMRERVYDRVEELLSDPHERASYAVDISDTEVVSRLRYVAASLSQSRISTFHSFCASLVRQYADVVNLRYDVRDASDREANFLVANAVASTIRAAADPHHELHTEFVRAIEYVSLETIERLVTAIARDRSRLQSAMSTTARTIEEIVQFRRSYTNTIQCSVATAVIRRIADALSGLTQYACYQACYSQCLAVLSILETDGYSEAAQAHFLALRSDFLTKSLAFNKRKVDKDAKKAEALPDLPEIDELYLQALTSTFSNNVEEDAAYVVQLTCRLGITAQELYTSSKREQNVIDFDDMVHETIHLLEHQDVRESVRSGITHIMIDEFQDTDPIQFHILEQLAPDLVMPAEKGPTVFVVGDDKQSIYQFRNADVRLFRKARHAIAASNTRVSHDDGMRLISRSFRMHPDLCDAVNQICATYFHESLRGPLGHLGYDVDYEPLKAGQNTPSTPDHARVFILNSSASTEEADDSRDADEYTLVACAIVDALHRNRSGALRPKDIAVLVPKNELKAHVAAALRTRGVPYTIYGGRAFYSRPEVADLRNALIACLDPWDNLATACVMRSPILKCSDTDIMSAALQGSSSSIHDGLFVLVRDGHATSNQRRAYSFLQEFNEQLRHTPVHRVLERMLEVTGWYATISNEERREQMVANVNKLIAVCRDLSHESAMSPFDIGKAISVPYSDTESEGVVLSDDDAVHVMTLHAAKGLEFDVVVLAGLASSSRSDTALETSEIGLTLSMPKAHRDIDNPVEIVSIPPSLSHLCNKIIAQQRKRAEDKRLLYVALTRAKHELILSLPHAEGATSSSSLADMLMLGVSSYGKATNLKLDIEGDASHYVHQSNSSPITIDQSHSISDLPISAITASELTQLTSISAHSYPAASAHIGKTIHETLASALKASLALDDEQLMEMIVGLLRRSGLSRKQTHGIALEVFATLRSDVVRDIAHLIPESRIEQQLVMLDSGSLLYGVLDVRLPLTDGIVRILDWKTSAIRDAGDLEFYGTHYRPQMQAYAKLCFSSMPDCTLVIAQLVFTKALQKGIKGTYELRFDRSML